MNHFANNAVEFTKKRGMVLLIDADSLIFAACCGVDDDINKAIGKFDEIYMHTINSVEELYKVDKFIGFANAKGNYRKIINKTYKANRTQPKPKLWEELKDIVVDQYSMKQAYGMETDDLVASYWYNLSKEIGRDNVMIISLDKDYLQLPALIYNYHYMHQTIYDISEATALKNLYTQMIVGDGVDNVNYCKGYGIKYAEKIYKDCSTEFQYMRKLFELFKKIYKQKAREKYIECYNLLCLAFWEREKRKL